MEVDEKRVRIKVFSLREIEKDRKQINKKP